MKDRIVGYLKENKARAALLLIALVGAALMVIPSGKDDGGADNEAAVSYKHELEAELEDMCSRIDGVGRCRVVLTLAEGERLEYSGSKLIASYPPRVLGIVVICEGADKSGVRQDITESLTALFDIGANRVEVVKMKK